MKLTLLFFFLLLYTVLSAQKTPKLKKGMWLAQLSLNEKDQLPFNLEISKNKKEYIFTVINGQERIILDNPIYKNDSLYVHFPYFNSELVFSIDSKTSINGSFYNYNKVNYKIPVKAVLCDDSRFKTNSEKHSVVSGKWEVEFEPNTNSSYPAIGLFNQNLNSNKITGTFLTETGDYRYLEGNIIDNKLFLSCFDGSHTFLFKADLINDTLYGVFNSGSHWKSEWKAFKNESFELKNPEEITYIVNNKPLEFNLKTINNNDYQYPNEALRDKVTIIQIMGTWCPNCLDETMFFKELYDKYHDKGLEIISIGFEVGNSFEDYSNNIIKYKEKLNLEFTFLVGGAAKKDNASAVFEMLNSISSFPTTLIINKEGEVVRIHTGFNGPGTGDYYTEYINSTTVLIERLLAF